MGALSHIRICDLSGLLAGAGATRFLAAFGADVIRVEDPTRDGRWDFLRTAAPFVDERRGINFGGPFNNHNVEKRGITLNLKTRRGRELFSELVRCSDVVTENFAAGVLDRLGFGYEQLEAIRPGIIYVSNCGFGHTGPLKDFKTFGPIVQAMSGLTFSSGLPDQPPAGWGYSYMNHGGAYFMAMAIMLALHHRNVTGEGQRVDLSCTEAGATLCGPALLDYTVNGRPLRRPGSPHSNRSQFPRMAPHNIYAAAGDDNWVAISVRHDEDWAALGSVVAEAWTADPRFASLAARVEHEDELDRLLEAWTSERNHFAVAARLEEAGVPAAPVTRPEERIDGDPNTAGWGLWPTAQHQLMGDVRVDGLPVHLSESDWSIERGGPTLGQHNEEVLTGLLGVDPEELPELRRQGVL